MMIVGFSSAGIAKSLRSASVFTPVYIPDTTPKFHAASCMFWVARPASISWQPYFGLGRMMIAKLAFSTHLPLVLSLASVVTFAGSWIRMNLECFVFIPVGLHL